MMLANVRKNMPRHAGIKHGVCALARDIGHCLQVSDVACAQVANNVLQWHQHKLRPVGFTCVVCASAGRHHS